MRHLRIFFKIGFISFRQALQQDVAFRVDFFTKILHTVIELIGGIGGLLIIYSKIQTINGWNFYESLTVTGMFMLIQNLKNMFIGPSLDSISSIGGELWNGSFDFMLLKPIPTQMYICIHKWSPLVIFDIIISIIILTVAVVNLNINNSIWLILNFFITLFISLLIFYSILLILASTAFWFLGTPVSIIFNSIMETGKYPIKIYPIKFQLILTWIIPVSFMISLPTEILIGSSGIFEILIGLIFGFILFITASFYFKLSLRKYSSASSQSVEIGGCKRYIYQNLI